MHKTASIQSKSLIWQHVVLRTSERALYMWAEWYFQHKEQSEHDDQGGSATYQSNFYVDFLIEFLGTAAVFIFQHVSRHKPPYFGLNYCSITLDFIWIMIWNRNSLQNANVRSDDMEKRALSSDKAQYSVVYDINDRE